MQLHSEGWEREEEEGRERGAAGPAQGMKEEARDNPAPSLKQLPRRPTTWLAKPWVPRPLVFHPGPPASRRSLGVCELPLPDGPTQLFPLAPFQLVIAAVVHHWTPPQFNPLSPVRGKGRGGG